MTEHMYWVTTPEYQTVEDRIDHYTLYGRGTDWECVRASSAREAVRVQVRVWLDPWVTCHKCHGVAEVPDAHFLCSTCRGRGVVRDPWKRDNYCLGRKLDGLCPWTGVRAEVARCDHGIEMPLDFEDDFWCDQCRAQCEADEAREDLDNNMTTTCFLGRGTP